MDTNFYQEKPKQVNEIIRKKWRRIIIPSLLATTVIITTVVSTVIIVNKKDTTNKGVTQELTYTKLTTNEFENLTDTYNEISNVYIKSIMTKQNIIYIPNELYEKLTNKETLNTIEQNDLNERLLNSIEGNMRMSSLLNKSMFNRDEVRNWDWNDKLLINKQKNNDELKITNLDLKYKNSNKKLPVAVIFKPSKTEKYDLQPIDFFTSQTVQKLFDQASLVNVDLNNRSGGYFAGLNFEGIKKTDGSWNGEQWVSLNDFNAKTYDWMLACFKRANLLPINFKFDYSNLFEIDGWNIDNIYVIDKKGIRVDKNYVYLSENNYFGPHSIVSKIVVTWKSLDPTKTNFSFVGSYLDNNQWGNY